MGCGRQRERDKKREAERQMYFKECVHMIDISNMLSNSEALKLKEELRLQSGFLNLQTKNSLSIFILQS